MAKIAQLECFHRSQLGLGLKKRDPSIILAKARYTKVNIPKMAMLYHGAPKSVARFIWFQGFNYITSTTDAPHLPLRHGDHGWICPYCSKCCWTCSNWPFWAILDTKWQLLQGSYGSKGQTRVPPPQVLLICHMMAGPIGTWAKSTAHIGEPAQTWPLLQYCTKKIKTGFSRFQWFQGSNWTASTAETPMFYNTGDGPSGLAPKILTILVNRLKMYMG